MDGIRRTYDCQEIMLEGASSCIVTFTCMIGIVRIVNLCEIFTRTMGIVTFTRMIGIVGIVNLS